MEVVPLTGGPRPPTEVLAERLRRAGCVCLVADRDLSRPGVDVEFFGEPARMPAGPGAAGGDDRCRPAAGRRCGSPRRRLGPADRAARSSCPSGRLRDRVQRHPGAGRRLRRAHRRASAGLAHAAEALAGGPVDPRPAQAAVRPLRRCGSASSARTRWDIPGGVQAHVRDLAETLIELGHTCRCWRRAMRTRPVCRPTSSPPARRCPIPYNGSVARLQFGLVSAARVRRWLRDGEFDVVHVHEPAPPSLSLLTCMIHDGPLVATFHIGHRAVAVPGDVRHRAAAVPGEAHRTDRRLRRGPQGDRRAPRRRRGRDPQRRRGAALRRAPSRCRVTPRRGGTVGFIGRYDEPRKGMDVLDRRPATARAARPDLRLLVAGRGDAEEFGDRLPPVAGDGSSCSAR